MPKANKRGGGAPSLPGPLDPFLSNKNLFDTPQTRTTEQSQRQEWRSPDSFRGPIPPNFFLAEFDYFEGSAGSAD
jgi:hypothetical protein